MYHSTMGIGLPVAVQCSTVKRPTLVLQGDLFAIEMIGGPTYVNRKQNNHCNYAITTHNIL